MPDDTLARAEARFHELMEQKRASQYPYHSRYDWLDIAYMVALENVHELGGSRWGDFVERVRPEEASRG